MSGMVGDAELLLDQPCDALAGPQGRGIAVCLGAVEHEQWTGIDGSITQDAYAEYLRCFQDPETIRATCLDYRAIDLDLAHDEQDRGRKLSCPVLLLWAARMPKRPGWQTGASLDILATWDERAEDVRGEALDCGHFLPEELPEEVTAQLLAFLSRDD